MAARPRCASVSRNADFCVLSNALDASAKVLRDLDGNVANWLGELLQRKSLSRHDARCCGIRLRHVHNLCCSFNNTDRTHLHSVFTYLCLWYVSSGRNTKSVHSFFHTYAIVWAGHDETRRVVSTNNPAPVRVWVFGTGQKNVHGDRFE